MRFSSNQSEIWILITSFRTLWAWRFILLFNDQNVWLAGQEMIQQVKIVEHLMTIVLMNQSGISAPQCIPMETLTMRIQRRMQRWMCCLIQGGLHPTHQRPRVEIRPCAAGTGRWQGTTFKRMTAEGHSINCLEPTRSKTADELTFTRPWPSVYAHCNISAC